MLALNVSKEVLDGFGQMFVKISDATPGLMKAIPIYMKILKLMQRKKEVSG